MLWLFGSSVERNDLAPECRSLILAVVLLRAVLTGSSDFIFNPFTAESIALVQWIVVKLVSVFMGHFSSSLNREKNLILFPPSGVNMTRSTTNPDLWIKKISEVRCLFVYVYGRIKYRTKRIILLKIAATSSVLNFEINPPPFWDFPKEVGER